MDSLGTYLSQYIARDPIELLLDCIDVLLVALLIHGGLLLLKQARAMRAGIAIAVLFVLYHSAQGLGLTTFHTTLGVVLTWLGFGIIMLFHQDLRRAVVRLSTRPLFASTGGPIGLRLIDEVVSAATSLSDRRIGGLIVFERRRPLEHVGGGTRLDAEPTRELLYSVFVPTHGNPLHDGAVIIRHGRIWQAGAVLPLSANPSLDSNLGTRHRAGLGASEDTDAVAVVVSEERGEMSLCYDGHLVRRLDAALLRKILLALLGAARHRHMRSRPDADHGSPDGSGPTTTMSSSEVS